MSGLNFSNEDICADIDEEKIKMIMTYYFKRW